MKRSVLKQKPLDYGVGSQVAYPSKPATDPDPYRHLPLWVSLLALLLSITSLVLHAREQIERDSSSSETVHSMQSKVTERTDSSDADETYLQDDALYGAKMYPSLDTRFFIDGEAVQPGEFFKL